MPKRSYTAITRTTQTGLTSTNGTTMTLASATGFPAAPFAAVVDPGTDLAEWIRVDAIAGTAVSSITRGWDGTTAVTHASGCVVTPDTSAAEGNCGALIAKWAALSGSVSATVAGGTQTIATATVNIPAGTGLAVVTWLIEVPTTENTTFYQCTIGGVATIGTNKRATTGTVATTANQVSTYFVYLTAPPTGSVVVLLTCSSVQTAGVIGATGIVEFLP